MEDQRHRETILQRFSKSLKNRDYDESMLILNSEHDSIFNCDDFEMRFRFMQQACSFGNAEIVEFMINNGMRVGDQSCLDDRTLLHYAVENGNLDIVKLLMSRYDLSQVKDIYGRKPIQLAGNNRMIEFLSAYEVEVDIKEPEYP